MELIDGCYNYKPCFFQQSMIGFEIKVLEAKMEKVNKIQVLFICTGNSARSQISEGVLRSKAGNMVDVYSGGTFPAKQVNPFAIKVMAENGIDISKHYPKSLDQYLNKEFDIIITTCDRAKQSCPIFPGNAIRYHWNLDDPAEVENEEERLLAFRKTFNEISKRVDDLMEVIRHLNSNKGKSQQEKPFLVLNSDES